ncbi:MAG: RNA polymerase sigma factor [Deltaproteobacteria bacterium]|nr:RNA polymerase sigma factor [Deltaproteobacteria bacterium]
MQGATAAKLDQEGETPGRSAVSGAGTGAPATAAGPDADIAEAIRAGKLREALALCARRHGATIGRLCMSLLGSQGEAEDIMQETLLAAYDGFAGWTGEGTLRAWVLAIARRKCARQIEKTSARRAKLRLVHDAEAEAAPDAEQALLVRQRAERARRALAAVRPSEREALVLRYGAGLGFDEIGQACGIAEAAARKRVSRGVAALRETLREQE